MLPEEEEKGEEEVGLACERCLGDATGGTFSSAQVKDRVIGKLDSASGTNTLSKVLTSSFYFSEKNEVEAIVERSPFLEDTYCVFYEDPNNNLGF